MTEDEMVGWHHQLNGHDFEQTMGDSEGQGKPGVLQSMGLQRVGHDRVNNNTPSKAYLTTSTCVKIVSISGAPCACL